LVLLLRFAGARSLQEEKKIMEKSANRIVKVGNLSSTSVSPIFVDLEIRKADYVRGRFELSELQGLQLVRSFTRGGKFEVFRSQAHIRSSHDDVLYACIPLSGCITLHQNERTCLLSRGDIGLMDARAEYHLEMSDELDAVWVRLLPGTLESRSGRPDGIVARRLDGSQGLGFIASRFILATASQVGRLVKSPSADISSILLDLLCAAAAAVDDPVPAALSRSSSRTLERAREFIELHLGEENLDPSQIAAGVNISTRYLSDLFAAEGTTTMQWISNRRLTLARSALAGQVWMPGCISDVAYRHGFSNVATFNRSFRRAFGVAPRQTMLRR
jgi:AraC-like DNA-binding protein